MDPDEVWRALAIRIPLCAVATLICHYVVVALLGQTGGHELKGVSIAITVAVSAPLWAAALVRPGLELFTMAYHWIRWLVWGGDSGNYFAFEGKRIRFFDVDGDPWMVERDAWHLTDPGAIKHVNWRKLPPEQYGPIPETPFRGFSEAGVMRLLEGRKDPDVRRVTLWLTREVYMPAAKKKQLGAAHPLAS